MPAQISIPKILAVNSSLLLSPFSRKQNVLGQAPILSACAFIFHSEALELSWVYCSGSIPGDMNTNTNYHEMEHYVEHRATHVHLFVSGHSLALSCLVNENAPEL